MLSESFKHQLPDQEEEEMKHKIEVGSADIVKDLEEKILAKELRYREKKGRKWITMLVGLLIGVFLGFFGMPYLY
jgi:hypothetical protein